MSNKHLFAGIGAILLLCGVFAAASFSGKPVRQPAAVPADGPQALEAHWHERIAQLGGAAAYKELAVTVATATPEQQHNAAHAFGGALFEVEGADGLAICDARFNFGCFHEFLGRAIATMGLSSVLALNQGCFEALPQTSLSCQHGIGHGIMAHLGYTSKALLKGLKQCKELPHNDPIGGCYGGLFMEYNLETMLSTEAKLRPLTSDPQVPCNQLDEDYRQACYYWQPQWWNQILKPQVTGVASFKQMGLWCLDAGTHRRDCFEGIGNITPPEAKFVPAQAKALCEEVSSNTVYQLYCKSVAANSLAVGGSGLVGDGMAVCQGLKGKDFDYCASYAHNKANILNRPEDPAL